MLRVVLDANVYVSALIRPQGPPGQIVKRFLEDSFEIVLSLAIVEETVRASVIREFASTFAKEWIQNSGLKISFCWLSSSLVTTSSRASA